LAVAVLDQQIQLLLGFLVVIQFFLLLLLTVVAAQVQIMVAFPVSLE
jgi:hypothetical protein